MCGFHNDDIGQFLETETTTQIPNPSFHAELITLHSALLKKSYLVSYPPLTYTLKFNGLAGLTNTIHINVYIYININIYIDNYIFIIIRINYNNINIFVK